MAPKIPRTGIHNMPSNSFNSSGLIRLLAELTNPLTATQATASGSDSKQSLAERLGLWLGWAEAISLATALNGKLPALPNKASGTESRAATPVEESARVRRHLADSIRGDALLAPAKPAKKIPLPTHDPLMDSSTDFSPYRRSYLAHQRAMETRIGPLRAQVRAALASHSAPMGRLAALDAALDSALAEREGHLLSTVPGLLERHFQRLRRAHEQKQADASVPEGPGGVTQPPVWREIYRQDMQAVLLAELDVRMQPIEGLIEALQT